MKKAGDTITINKPGHLLHGISTEIISINPDCSRPVKITYCVDWFLTYAEAGIDEPTNIKMANEAQISPVKAIKPRKAIVNPVTKKVAKNALNKPETIKGKRGRPKKY